MVKIAFVGGMEPERTVAGPGAQVATPVIQASRATLTNKVEIKATVQSDAAIGVRNSAAGEVTYIFLEPGAKVALGDRLYQVRSEVKPEPHVAVDSAAENGPYDASSARQAPPAAVQPAYTYTDVVAPASGELKSLDVLINQQVSVGETAGSVDPGTFTVGGTVDAAQQYRLLAKPGSAQVALVGGPAPFTCPSVVLESTTDPAAGGSSGAGVTSGMSGGAGRTVPYAQAGPGTAGGAPEQGGTPTGTLSCAVPSSVEVFAGLGATMTVTAGEAVNVVSVPLTAVEGSVKEGIVWLAGTSPASGPDGAASGAPGPAAPGVPAGVPAGEPEQRKVQLGLNDGSRVEVVSGLAEGEAILEFIPGAPAQMPPGPQFAGPGIPVGG
ncbi:efflux RND transporter periplasmic adaptor subunit [Arthrobacter sp. SLBN-100]|uniref:hypothetical protein n=1 Tax=Arthrobacter sp. SLBN-100 TaxID=2768450 RepID=UPI00114FD2B2|nr:hypothetical protein [Arthrobacter sp. SLBN-100]